MPPRCVRTSVLAWTAAALVAIASPALRGQVLPNGPVEGRPLQRGPAPGIRAATTPVDAPDGPAHLDPALTATDNGDTASATDATPPLRVHLSVGDEPWSYVPPPAQGHCLQTYRLFLPPDELDRPPGGWPVLVQVKLSGFRQTPDVPSIEDDTFLADYLDAGIAVVVARVTPSIDVTDPLWQRGCAAPPGDLPGRGLFHPPGVVPPDLAASGIAPYDSDLFPMAEKDAVMLLQRVRFLARQEHGLDTEEELAMAQLDHRLVAVHGVSAGGMALMWAAVGPDRRDEAPFAGRTGPWAETSRPDVAAFELAATWMPAFHPDVRPPTPHLGMYGHSNIPAPTLGDADPAELRAASPLAYADPDHVRALPVWMRYDEPSWSADHGSADAGCPGPPPCFPGAGLEGLAVADESWVGMHPAWSGYAWTTRFPRTELVITDPAAWAQRGDVDAVPLFDVSAGARRKHLLDWILARFDDIRATWGPDDDRWKDLGYGLAGSRGVPRLTVTSTPADDGAWTLRLDGALPDARVAWVGGEHPRLASLAGGVVVPWTTHAEAGRRTDASGALVWRVPDDGGDARTVYVQALVEDPGAPRGVAFTNALRVTFGE